MNRSAREGKKCIKCFERSKGLDTALYKNSLFSPLLLKCHVCVTGDKLTEDDLNSLIAHAHRRITQIQRQSASQQVRYQHDLELALARQCEEGAQLAQQKMTLEQRSLRNEFEMEKAKWVSFVSAV